MPKRKYKTAHKTKTQNRNIMLKKNQQKAKQLQNSKLKHVNNKTKTNE